MIDITNLDLDMCGYTYIVSSKVMSTLKTSLAGDDIASQILASRFIVDDKAFWEKIQKRRHKRSRINKKWLKRYGSYYIEGKNSNEIMIIKNSSFHKTLISSPVFKTEPRVQVLNPMLYGAV